MSISAADVKKLREMTGAGMLDCKKALEEAGGDLEKAKEILRVKGLAKAEKKVGRETKEGIIRVKLSEDRKKGAIIELSCETDFVARNEEFQKLADDILDHILALEENANREGFGEDILSQPFYRDTAKRIDELIKESIARIGENIRLARYVRYDTEDYLHSYVHGGGRIGVLLDFKAPGLGEKTLRLVQDIAMQVAAMRPEFVSPESVPEEIIEKEKNILMEQARQEGKPQQVLERIVEGRLRKFYEDKVLTQQPFIKDDRKTVGQVIEEAGLGVEIKRFVRFELGGI